MSVLEELVALGNRIADPAMRLCIGAEGNVAGRMDGGTFLVKASGATMYGCSESDFVEVISAPLLNAISSPPDGVTAVREVLNSSRIKVSDPPPSTESYVHAVLFQSERCAYAVHTHAEEIISLSSLDEGAALANVRLFPDQVVFCGPATLHVPYSPPGLPLAREIQSRLAGFAARWGESPTVLFLENHGLITCGAVPEEAEMATLIATKAARSLLDCLASGRSFRSMSPDEIAAIRSWPDEHERKKKMFGA